MRRGQPLTLILAGLLVFGCAAPSRAAESSPAGAVMGAENVAPAHRDAYERLARAVRSDPAAGEVDAAAEALLALSPPGDLVSRAELARAERAWLGGADDVAVRSARSGKAVATDPAVLRALQRVELRALTRGGDPDQAVALWASVEKDLPVPERQALRALSLDRSAAHEPALLAMLEWRAVLSGDEPSAAYAMDRAAVLLAGMTLERLEELAPGLTGGPRACVERYLGRGKDAGPAWTGQCRPRPMTLGLLLPRTGKYAALGDVELAAAAAAVEVLAPDPDAVAILWRDSGSGGEAARAGMESLLADGVDVVVGPVAPASIDRALDSGAGVPLVVPGEARRSAAGVAPSLEARVEALVRHAGRRPLVVLGPDNPYGKRALAAATKVVQETTGKSPRTQTYPEGTTSFSKVLAAAPVRPGEAMLVADQLGRVELLVRQLRRDGATIGGGANQVLVLSTGEGAGGAPPTAALEGVVLAPVATATGDAEPFIAAYEAREGAAPGDHALLVFRAIRVALQGGKAAPARPRLVAVQGGHLVSVQASGAAGP